MFSSFFLFVNCIIPYNENILSTLKPTAATLSIVSFKNKYFSLKLPCFNFKFINIIMRLAFSSFNSTKNVGIFGLIDVYLDIRINTIF